MFTKSIILILVLFKSGECIKRNCSDCTFVQGCPEANALRSNRDPEIVRKFRNSTCDWIKTHNNKRLIRKVCCSDFTEVKERSQDADEVETHKNFILLPDDCGKIYQERIVGGEAADLYEYPFMALLRYSYKGNSGKTTYNFECGGTIINSKFILTAAHCVQNVPIAGVRVGEYDLSRRTDCQGTVYTYVCESHIQDLDIEKMIVHEQYNARAIPVQNDIALLRVKDSIDFGHKNVAPICLPVSKDMQDIVLSGKDAIVAGWGVTENRTRSNVLLKVEVPIKAENDCFKYLYRNKKNGLNDLPMTTLCAGGVIGKDSCRGDSGGPLMMVGPYQNLERVVQVGIVSQGPIQCGASSPAIYTDVRRYLNWILDHIEA